jgi:hypothetical protein
VAISSSALNPLMAAMSSIPPTRRWSGSPTQVSRI